MSTDIYIPLEIVLNYPGQFRLETALNGDIEMAREALNEDNPLGIDWDYVQSELKPVLLCKFGARDAFRFVEVFDHDLCVKCSGQFRDWLIFWLDDHGYKYLHI